MAANDPNDKKLLPWMPYIFGFILVLALVGFIILFTQKNSMVEQTAPPVVLSKDVIQPAKNILDDIKAKKLKEAYNKGSSDFKVSMSFDAFSRFINSYDSLQGWSTVTFSPAQIEGGVAGVIAYLHFDGQEETLPISFTLTQEDGQWKVYGFILNREDLHIPLKQIEALKDLIKVVNQELAYLSKENAMSAYYKMASKKFQSETSYEAFVQFLQETPIFSEQQGATLFDGAIDGDSGKLKVSFYTDEETVPFEFYLAKEEGKWKIDKIETLISPSLQKPLAKKEVEDSMQVIDLFLTNLREDLPEKAYNVFASEGFQKSTSLKLFETFVEDHPILTEDVKPQFIEGGKEGKERIIYLVYNQHPNTTAFEVKLIEEDGSWKIQAISIESEETSSSSETVDKGEAIDLVQNVLNLIGSGHYEKFYRSATSKGFKRSTSYDNFLSYLKLHPVLKNNPKPFIQEMMQDRDQLYLETDLIDATHTYSALFAFVFEKGSWKVLRIETKAERRITTASIVAMVDLSHIMVGQEIDDAGMIQDSGKPIERGNDPIYVSVLLTSTTPEGEIELTLTHDESNSTTFPVRGIVDNEGNNILSFTFMPPPDGWPDGSYKASAKTQGDQLLNTPFLVERKDP